jgi:hypothetical protein
MPRRSERPTRPPSFDAAQYAKDSDARVRTAHSVAKDEAGSREAPHDVLPRSETRIATRPKTRAAIADDAWAQKMTGAPIVAVSADELRRLPLDHRAGFLLSLMDGTIDLDSVIEISAMSRESALRLVRDLFESGVVAFR